MDNKKILLISPHFYPENFKCNDVAFELARRGYDVTVLSDIPNDPGGKFFKGYGLFKKRKENCAMCIFFVETSEKIKSSFIR